MNIAELENNAERAADLLGAMANPRRLMVLCKLLEGEKSVNTLADSVGLSQSALSQHLAKLREKGLVSTRRDAQTIFYGLASEEVRGILSTLYGLYCEPDVLRAKA
ncbi:MAG: metalloregulator ArsR/SmtB family transcription factor [Nitratireductor sp.]